MAENIETPEITGQSQGAQTSAGGNAASKISSMLKGLQNFNVADFVKGKPGQWQKMAVVAVVVIIVMGLGAVMMWGLALWALANSFGDPSSRETCVNGAAPDTVSEITIEGKTYKIPDDGKGKISSEDHLVTRDDPNKSPSSTSDGIEDHLRVTNFSTNCTGLSLCNSEGQRWTPAEGGGRIGQGSVAIGSIPANHEPWVMNARWPNPTPKPGTIVIISAEKTGKSIAAVAGYEWGPSASTGHVAGAQKEVLSKLGIAHGDQVTFGFAKDQSIVPGTIYTNSGGTQTCSGRDFSGPGMMYDSNAFTAQQIDNYLSNKSPRSPLNGKGAAFVASGKKYGVNPGFMLAISNSETSLGMQCIDGSSPPAPRGVGGSQNAFGLTRKGQGTFITYPSYEAGIERAAMNIASQKYKNLDQSLREFRLKWCGYETESERPGIKLSDGSVITYSCDNGRSKWEEEILAVMNGIK